MGQQVAPLPQFGQQCLLWCSRRCTLLLKAQRIPAGRQHFLVMLVVWRRLLIAAHGVVVVVPAADLHLSAFAEAGRDCRVSPRIMRTSPAVTRIGNPDSWRLISRKN